MNDCVSQVKRLDPVSEGKEARKRFFFGYIVHTVLIEHHLYERITATFRVE